MNPLQSRPSIQRYPDVNTPQPIEPSSSLTPESNESTDISARPAAKQEKNSIHSQQTAFSHQLAAKQSRDQLTQVIIRQNNLKDFSGSSLSSPERLNASRVFIDPAKRSKMDDKTRKLALRQTTAARKLLYFPNAMLTNELKKAAANFKAIIDSMTSSELDFFMSFNFGTNELFPEKSSKSLGELLDRLIEARSSNATDRAVFISIMGMIGKEYMGATKQKAKGKEIPAKKLQFMNLFSKKAGELGLAPLSDDLVNRIRLLGDSEALAPRKREEQPDEADQANEVSPPLRSGVHDLGEDADNAIEIDLNKRIPKVTWPIGKIHEERVSMTLEPMVDHVSGRAARTLIIWDLLCEESSEDLYKGLFETHQRELAANPEPRLPMNYLDDAQQQAKLARIAGTCGMLIGVGYHTALELVEGALIYTGQNLRSVVAPLTDAGNLLGNGAATDLMVELFTHQTSYSA